MPAEMACEGWYRVRMESFSGGGPAESKTFDRFKKRVGRACRTPSIIGEIRLKRRKLRAPHRMPLMRPTDRKTNRQYRESYSRLFDIRRVVLRPFGPEPPRSCRHTRR